MEAKSCARITPSFHASLRKSQLKAGDILVVRVGANRGDSCMVPRGLGELNCANIIFARPLYRGDFFGLFTRSDLGQHLLLSASTGAAQGVINTQSVAALPVPVPSWGVQQRIASILCAYDDLIENNTRRIATLKEMARCIYEEWFVRFRFPGHQGARMVESELGLMPDDWVIAAADEVTTTLGGGTPSKAEPTFWESGEINWYSPTDLTGAGTVFMAESRSRITQLGLENSSARMFPARSVMMTSRATIGAIAVNTTEACTNQGFITCVPSERYPLWLLYHWLKANTEVFESLGTGATFKEVTKGVFRKIKLLVPPSSLASQFERSVGPMMELILRLERTNQNLRTARDLLLPKLISGELDVSELPVPEAIAA